MTFSSIKKLLFLISVPILLASRQYCMGSEKARYMMPAHAFDDALSTNWMAAVKAALPVKYSTKGDLDFQQATNLLCQETQRGNNAAQGLWGFTLVALSHSPKDAEAGLQLLRDSAEKDNVPAMLQLGSLYEVGKYVRKNYNEEFHWFNLAADKGDPNAQLKLGVCYRYGFGTTPDFVLAAKYYRRSAEQTNYMAMEGLGYLLMNGFGVEKDSEAAKYWFTRAAKEGGVRRAMYNLGVLSSMKYPDAKAVSETFQWFKQSAELNDPLACLELSKCYDCGWGVETNFASYHYWRIKAAMLGATEAQYLMGVAYRTGDGVPKDTNASLVWYRKAAVKNHPKALYDLAVHYFEDRTNRTSLIMANNYLFLAAQAGNRQSQFQCAMSCFRGDVAPVNFENGRQWLAKAAEAGWAQAEFCLFQLYYNGVAPAPQCPPYPKDKVEAIKWIRRAADHKNLQAQSTLAIMLIRGMDVETDKTAAEKLLRNAAEHGYAQAQNDLGFAIENGDISSMDMVESAMWCKLAKSHLTDPNILQRAEVNLSNALSRLTLDQQLEVDQRVKNFQVLPVVVIDPMPVGWETNASFKREDIQ
jgi:TPR repeat protein